MKLAINFVCLSGDINKQMNRTEPNQLWSQDWSMKKKQTTALNPKLYYL